ncbi:MAG: hypothetical protein LBG72_01710 [Spirochaetaceae bacterium]|nr:hypothetical protein [Spirochaetaceae bacterium]
MRQWTVSSEQWTAPVQCDIWAIMKLSSLSNIYRLEILSTVHYPLPTKI